MKPSQLGVVGVLAGTLVLPIPAGAATQASDAAANSNRGGPQIIVNPNNDKGEISPLLFGADNGFDFDAHGTYDSSQQEMFPKFLEQTENAGISIVRYPGGGKANTFHFERAIGPQSERTDQIGFQAGLAGTHNVPLSSTFGPDEHGAFVESIGAKMNLQLNWGTGTADEAANFVEYMTAPLGTNPRGGTAWAQVRADNGHPEPYDIPFVEVGNEVGAAWQSYWAWPRNGTPMDERCSGLVGDEQFVCHYVHGGSMRIEHHRAKRVGGVADRRFDASHSDGSANQVFYAYLPPVVPENVTLTVDGVEWHKVSDLDQAGQENVFELRDPATGEIVFGDGVNGNIPPEGALINIGYVSGRHDGFDDFYREVKAANPDIDVCPMMPRRLEEMFLEQVDEVDCIAQHPSTSASKADFEFEGSFEDFHIKAMLEADKRREETERQQEMVQEVLGHSLPVYLTEYALYPPRGLPSQGHNQAYAAGLDHGLYMANALRHWIDMGIEVAEKNVLAGSPFDTLEPGAQPNWPAMIMMSGSEAIPQAAALVMNQFTHMMGSTYVDSRVVSDITQTTTDGVEAPSLNTVASKDADGNLYLIVINQNHNENIETTVRPLTSRFRYEEAAEVWTVNGDGMFAFNSPEHPDDVTLTKDTAQVGGPSFDYSFPAGSVTAIKLAPRGDSS